MASARLLLLASLVLLAAAAAAGCLASDGPASASADAPQDGGGPGQAGTSGGSSDGGARSGSQNGSDGASGGNGTGNGTASGNATTGWRNQTRTGGFSGANVVFGIFGKTESFPVSEDAVNLTLVIRAPDAELSGSISPPCESDGFGGCPSRSYETAGGTYTYRTAHPDPGEWSVSFFRDDSGAGHQRYILEIHRQVRTAG